MKKLIAIIFAISLIAPLPAQANDDLININAAEALLEKQGLSDPTSVKEIEKERQKLYKISVGLKTSDSSMDSGWIYVKKYFEGYGIYEDCLKSEIGKTTKFTSLITGKKVSVTCKNLGSMGLRYVDKYYRNRSTGTKTSNGKCWVSGYIKSNGTQVDGYYRKCRG